MARYFLHGIVAFEFGVGLVRPNNLLTSTALTTSAMLASGAAFAQPAAYNWTGWYIGVNGGYASTQLKHDLSVPPSLDGDPSNFLASSGRSTMFAVGGQAGYNWLFVPNWLIGIEADIDYLGASLNSNVNFRQSSEDVVGQQKTRLRWLATVRGRFGYTWANTLIYATGGLAIGDVKSTVDATRIDLFNGRAEAQFAGSYSAIRTGWVVGGGIEQALNNLVSLRIEYLHFDLGSFSYNVNLVSGATSTDVPSTWLAHGSVSGDIVRAAVNLKFGPP